jgi:hypothetical protein
MNRAEGFTARTSANASRAARGIDAVRHDRCETSVPLGHETSPRRADDAQPARPFDRAVLQCGKSGVGEVIAVMHRAHEAGNHAAFHQRRERVPRNAIVRVIHVERLRPGIPALNVRRDRGRHETSQVARRQIGPEQHGRAARGPAEPARAVRSREEHRVVTRGVQRLGQRQRVQHAAARLRRVGADRDAHWLKMPPRRVHP